MDIKNNKAAPAAKLRGPKLMGAKLVSLVTAASSVNTKPSIPVIQGIFPIIGPHFPHIVASYDRTASSIRQNTDLRYNNVLQFKNRGF